MGKPCKTVQKSYSSSVYIDIGTGRIAFLLPKAVQNELFLQAVHTCTPWRNSTFVAQNRTNVHALGFGALKTQKKRQTRKGPTETSETSETSETTNKIQ